MQTGRIFDQRRQPSRVLFGLRVFRCAHRSCAACRICRCVRRRDRPSRLVRARADRKYALVEPGASWFLESPGSGSGDGAHATNSFTASIFTARRARLWRRLFIAMAEEAFVWRAMSASRFSVCLRLGYVTPAPISTTVTSCPEAIPTCALPHLRYCRSSAREKSLCHGRSRGRIQMIRFCHSLQGSPLCSRASFRRCSSAGARPAYPDRPV